MVSAQKVESFGMKAEMLFFQMFGSCPYLLAAYGRFQFPNMISCHMSSLGDVPLKHMKGNDLCAE